VVEFLVRWAILAVAVWVAASLIGGIHLEGWESTLLVALILGLLNALLKPILVFITLPLTILTLGIFILILNTAMLALTAWIAGKFDQILFSIDDFWAAFLGALIIAVVTWVLSLFVNAQRVGRRFSF
jgi:putative membrane protein